MRKAVDGIIHYGDREVCADNADGRRRYAARIERMRQRQGEVCPWCLQYLAEGQATFGHAKARGLGGASRDDRIVTEDGEWMNCAMHYTCNGLQGSRHFHWKDGRWQAAKEDA